MQTRSESGVLNHVRLLHGTSTKRLATTIGCQTSSLVEVLQFNEMMADAMDQKFDLIIVKSISRLARNVVVLLSTIRKLAEKKIGVLFESEAVYSLNDMSHLALTFQATVAEEESRIRSRSMEASLRMRLDHGLPLTPELLGFIKDEDGKLVMNPETANIPRLMFSMYRCRRCHKKNCLFIQIMMTFSGGTGTR